MFCLLSFLQPLRYRCRFSPREDGHKHRAGFMIREGSIESPDPVLFRTSILVDFETYHPRVQLGNSLSVLLLKISKFLKGVLLTSLRGLEHVGQICLESLPVRFTCRWGLLHRSLPGIVRIISKSTCSRVHSSRVSVVSPGLGPKDRLP